MSIKEQFESFVALCESGKSDRVSLTLELAKLFAELYKPETNIPDDVFASFPNDKRRAVLMIIASTYGEIATEEL